MASIHQLSRYLSPRNFFKVTILLIILVSTFTLFSISWSSRLKHKWSAAVTSWGDALPSEGREEQGPEAGVPGTLAHSLKMAASGGWKAVMVGEGQAPQQCREPHCRYLGPDQQAGLGPRTSALLAPGSPARRSLALLWVLQQGARLLYEADDGVLLYLQEASRPREAEEPRFLRGFSRGTKVSALAYVGAGLFNPFRHFGQATLWPRGFPLSAVGQKQPSEYVLFRWPAPLIQHKLVNGDPDVDAVFRLTRNLHDQPLNVTFDSTAPNVLLPRGVLAPFGGRGSLFRPEAFWALLLPDSPSRHVSDIWRSYWAQRLLWEIGGTVSFIRPDTYEEGSPARLSVADLQTEGGLYLKASQLVDFLHAWTCPPHLPFSACVLRLSQAMAEAGFWQRSDADLVSAWLEDLQALGYALPARASSPCTRDKLLEHFHGQALGPNDAYDPDTRMTRVLFHPVQKAPPLLSLDLGRRLEEAEHLRLVERLQSLCPAARFQLRGQSARAGVVRPRTLLVTEFNHPHYDNIPHLERNNRHRYPTLLYCGDNITKFLSSDIGSNTDVTYVEASVFVRGFTGYECMIHAIDMGYNVDAFFFLSEDVLVNFWNMDDSFSKSTWTVEYKWNPDPWWVPWKGPMGISTITKTLTELNAMSRHDPDLQQLLKRVIRNLYSQRNVSIPAVVPNSTSVLPGGLSDVYQVSAEDAPLFVRLARVFRKHETYMEAGVPFILSGLHGEKVVKFTPGVAGYPPDAFLTKYRQTLKYIHPVKWRLAFQKPGQLKFLCENYYPNMFKEV